MKRSAHELVAELKELNQSRHGQKLQMQRDMVELRDEYKWSHHKIADETGIPRATVIRWLEAYDEQQGGPGGPRLTPESVQTASDRRVAKRVIIEDPAVVATFFDEAPVEVQEEIARALSVSPVIRLAAQKKDTELYVQSTPNRAQAGEDLALYRFAAKLHSAFGNLRKAHDLLGRIDRTDEEDPNIISELERIKMLLEVIDEAYRTGKSIDTWAAELWEEAK